MYITCALEGTFTLISRIILRKCVLESREPRMVYCMVWKQKILDINAMKYI